MPFEPQHEDDFPSLGWALLDWYAEFLPSPRDPSEPLLLVDDQALAIVEFYRLDPTTGARVYRRGYSRRSKGKGKSPWAAAWAVGEFAGPVRFAGWDANGQPVGRPWGTHGDPRPWVQIGAVSEDQTDNTWSVIHYFLTENDGKAADNLGIDPGLTRCFLRGLPGAKMEPVTSAAGSREGQPVTAALLDESHLMVPANGGVKLAKTMRRNVAKMGGTSFETTNAFVLGAQSAAESSYDAVRAGAPGIFADEVEAPHEVDGVPVDLAAPDEVLVKALDVAYGDSFWVDRRRLVADMRDPSNVWGDSARFFLNWNMPAISTTVKLPPDLWLGTHTPEFVDVEPGRCVVAIDATPGSRFVSVAIGAGTATSPYVEVIKHEAGSFWVPDEVVRLVGKWQPLAVGLDAKGASGGLLGPIRAALIDAGIVPDDVLRVATYADMQQWCEAFLLDVLEGRLRVPERQGHLDLAAANATERKVGEGWLWDRRDPAVPLSPLVAATIARGLAVELIPEPVGSFFVY